MSPGPEEACEELRHACPPQLYASSAVRTTVGNIEVIVTGINHSSNINTGSAVCCVHGEVKGQKWQGYVF